MSREDDAAAAIRAAAEEIRGAAASHDAAVARARVTRILWATVELDRAERELGAVLGVELEARPVGRDEPLGASARLARPFGPPPEPALVLVEPDTEGRLAALLARHGEGVVAVDVEFQAAGTARERRLELTSGPGGRPPRAPSGRRPAAGG